MRIERLMCNIIGGLNDKGPGGKQILCLDPDGNLVELYEPDTSMGVTVSEIHIK